jgi:isopentenyl phosphate kinase (EC 2.7.4.-)
MFIVKFGGSAITDKTKPYTFLRGRIAQAALRSAERAS